MEEKYDDRLDPMVDCVSDEDDMFEMTRLMVSMAEGLMMSSTVLGPSAAMEVMTSLEGEYGISSWDHS